LETVTISLPESLKAFVEKEVATKGFGNVSEYFRTLLRDAQERDAKARLEAALLEGLASGTPKSVDKAFWTDLRGEAQRLIREHAEKGKKKK
jgi:antitoxin ParD1/3/4